MAKKIRIVLTLQLPAGKATPAPPVGTALGPHGINIVEFTKSYNEKTADKPGQIIPAQITVYEDRSFSFILKTPPAADLLRKVSWPTLEQVRNLTVLVFAISLVVGIYIAVLDAFFQGVIAAMAG